MSPPDLPHTSRAVPIALAPPSNSTTKSFPRGWAGKCAPPPPPARALEPSAPGVVRTKSRYPPNRIVASLCQVRQPCGRAHEGRADRLQGNPHIGAPCGQSSCNTSTTREAQHKTMYVITSACTSNSPISPLVTSTRHQKCPYNLGRCSLSVRLMGHVGPWVPQEPSLALLDCPTCSRGPSTPPPLVVGGAGCRQHVLTPGTTRPRSG